jgi:hypothetical protein
VWWHNLRTRVVVDDNVAPFDQRWPVGESLWIQRWPVGESLWIVKRMLRWWILNHIKPQAMFGGTRLAPYKQMCETFFSPFIL